MTTHVIESGGLFRKVDDRNPVKLLVAARDVISGIMLPWHLCNAHRVMICEMRDRLENAVYIGIGDEMIEPLLRECVKMAEFIASDCAEMKSAYRKMDNARLTLMCILEYAQQHIKSNASK